MLWCIGHRYHVQNENPYSFYCWDFQQKAVSKHQPTYWTASAEESCFLPDPPPYIGATDTFCSQLIRAAQKGGANPGIPCRVCRGRRELQYNPAFLSPQQSLVLKHLQISMTLICFRKPNLSYNLHSQNFEVSKSSERKLGTEYLVNFE